MYNPAKRAALVHLQYKVYILIGEVRALKEVQPRFFFGDLNVRKNQSFNFEESALAAGASALNQNCYLDIILDASEVSQKVNPNLGHKRTL